MSCLSLPNHARFVSSPFLRFFVSFRSSASPKPSQSRHRLVVLFAGHGHGLRKRSQRKLVSFSAMQFPNQQKLCPHLYAKVDELQLSPSFRHGQLVARLHERQLLHLFPTNREALFASADRKLGTKLGGCPAAKGERFLALASAQRFLLAV